MHRTALENLRARVPEETRRRLRQRLRRYARPAWLGTMRRTTPLSEGWGYDRGLPIDRHYIEQFLAGCRGDIRGRVLEVKDSSYTNRFGVAVTESAILDVDPANPHATIVADLAAASAIPDESFDCFVLTQTLQFIYDTRGALCHACRILRPGGILLATVPAVSRIARRPGIAGDYWRFTLASCEALFGEVFGAGQVRAIAYGNVLATIAFLTGLACEDLTRRELLVQDPYFPLIIAVRAVNQ